jgi:hypothetical protein
MKEALEPKEKVIEEKKKELSDIEEVLINQRKEINK